MANKLPWFTHDHVARNDEFMQSAMDKFGHFGYAAFFMLLEVIHEHGVGGVVTMTKGRLSLNLRSRWPQVHQYLDFCRTAGKLEFKIIGDQVELQNKKFIERQRKMKSNALSKLHERSSNARTEGDVDGEGERKTAAPAAADRSKELSTIGDMLGITSLDGEQLLEMQLPFSFGDIPKGRRIMDIAPQCAESILVKMPKLGFDLVRALRYRIKIKQDELYPKLRTA